ncbi:MAG: sigma-54-dependent Fis family transcriptional regulator [Deltaproteobacteria bacterium]|nr:sigma-54-dependent Fis family transcriptional regulator [Deltaproteobacteria bacterium]
MARVLVVDDEPGLREFMAEVLRDAGHHVEEAQDGQRALDLLRESAYHLVLTDLKMPRLGGLELLRAARAEQPELLFIVLTAHGTVQTAVEAMRAGAFDYLKKPLSGPDELEIVVARALQRRRGQDAAEAASADDEFVARDPVMEPVVGALRKVARTDATVLLLGESGTGKEVAARAVHRWSRRADGPFVAINCATMSETLLQSELFGHEKGAFTGATARRRGKVELAEGGTLFLDEIGELEPALQARLLRVLQERTFERVGGTQTIAADVRWVAATNRDLGGAMQQGTFREDLYHRLAVFPIQLPPLRHRPADIEHLAQYLLARAAGGMGRSRLTLSSAALHALRGYDWPGNVRELSNALERAAILAEGDEVGPDHVILGMPGATPSAPPPTTLVEAEKAAISAALTAEGGNRERSAARLGISLRSLYDKLKKHGL